MFYFGSILFQAIWPSLCTLSLYPYLDSRIQSEVFAGREKLEESVELRAEPDAATALMHLSSIYMSMSMSMNFRMVLKRYLKPDFYKFTSFETCK